MIFMDSLLVLELFHSLIMRLVQSGFQAIVTLLFLSLILSFNLKFIFFLGESDIGVLRHRLFKAE